MLCGYWPLSRAAREGQQSGEATTYSLKVVPASASSRVVAGIVRRLNDAAVWSSVWMTTMLGRVGSAAPLSSGSACRSTTRPTTAAMSRAVAAVRPTIRAARKEPGRLAAGLKQALRAQAIAAIAAIAWRRWTKDCIRTMRPSANSITNAIG